MRFLRHLAAITLSCTVAAWSAAAAQQAVTQQGTGSVAGRVTDKGSGAGLVEATVEISMPPARGKSTKTVEDGRYQISGLPAGTYRLVVKRIGLISDTVSVTVRAGETATVNVTTATLAQQLGRMTIVSVSRGYEKQIAAPAHGEVVGPTEIAGRVVLTPYEHVRSVPGLDMSSAGLIAGNLVARGFNNIFSGTLLTLTDYRFASVPSLRVNVPYLIPTTNEDIERIEVVLGPGAALYGPNSANGVMHIITKSPFESEGTSVTVGAGERDVVRGGLRHAQALGDKVAFKVSGDWMTGNDWQYVDPAEPASSRRDYGIRRWAGEARVDVRPANDVEWITSYGRVNAGSAIELTGTSGAAQVKNWTYSSAQTRLRAGRFFAQVFGNFSDAGDTRLLRTNSPIVDQSRLYVAQVQHYVELLDRRVKLTYGGDYQHTEPRTGGTINGRNEDNDNVNEYGGYLHTLTRLTNNFDLVAAARVDQNDRISGSVFSPRAALVFKPDSNQNVRLTYNRAFTTPANFSLFLDLPSGTIPFGPLGTFRVVALGVPKAGLHFRRDCAGLCMRSPFAAIPGTPATPSQFLEADATLRWRAATEILISQNSALAFLRTLPPPTKASVSSNLGVLNPTSRTFQRATASQVRDIEGLKPSLSNTIEAGYQGLLANRLRLAVDVWHDARRNFVGPSLVETPNVFLDSATTAQYLAQFVPAATAQAIAGGYAKVPLGTISPDHPLTNSPGPDIIVTYRNYGKLNVWGSDAAAELMVTDRLSLLGSYSWVNKDLFPKSEVGGLSDVTLNAPPSKASVAGRYRDNVRQWGWELRGRYVSAFPVQSGVYSGDVERYTLLDATADYKLPFSANVYLLVTAQNLLDKKHREFVGVPELGRFVMTQLRYSF